MALYFITGNKAKFAEVKAIFENVEQLELDLPEMQEIDARAIIRAKLAEAQKHHRGEFMVEDTSLYIHATNGLPGPLIKWFLMTVGNEGLYSIASSFGDFAAEAKTLIGYADAAGSIEFFEGSISGRIVKPRGKSEFGWDPVFEPAGYGKTFAELSASEKNALSMRRIAVDNLKKYLNTKT